MFHTGDAAADFDIARQGRTAGVQTPPSVHPPALVPIPERSADQSTAADIRMGRWALLMLVTDTYTRR